MSLNDASDVAPSDLLSDATLAALDLPQQPFGPLGPNTNSFSDETTAEQLADVKQALITGDDLLLILGADGSGKSIMLKQLSEHSGLRIQCFSVKGSERFSTMNLFAGLLEAFKHPPPEKLQDILDDLIPYLQTMISRNTLSIIVLDDAHLVNEAELTQLLSSMLYVNSQDETLVRVAMAAVPLFEEHIPDLLPAGADLPYSSLNIHGLDSVRAADFIDFRMQQAGLSGEPSFTEPEIIELVEQSDGLPGPLQAAAAHALNEQYGPIRTDLGTDLATGGGAAWLQSRMGKIAMGVIASLFIVLGILMFLPGKSNENSTRYTVSETAPVTLSDATPNGDVGLVQSSELTKALEETRNSVPGATAKITLNGLATEEPSPTVADNEQATSESATESGASIALGDDASAANTPIVIVAAPETNTTEAQATLEPAPAPIPAPAPEPQIDEPVAPVAETVAEEAPSPAAEESSSSNVSTGGELESSSWILVQDRDLFTVQMSASRDRASVVSFLNQHASALSAPNSIYSFARDGSTWYALLHGLYSSIDEARASVETMPAATLINQPWIRSVARVQDVLKAQ